MLVLTPRINGSITIGDDITLRFYRGKYGQLRMAIDAPKDMPINRDNAKRKHPGAQIAAEEIEQGNYDHPTE